MAHPSFVSSGRDGLHVSRVMSLKIGTNEKSMSYYKSCFMFLTLSEFKEVKLCYLAKLVVLTILTHNVAEKTASWISPTIPKQNRMENTLIVM